MDGKTVRRSDAFGCSQIERRAADAADGADAGDERQVDHRPVLHELLERRPVSRQLVHSAGVPHDAVRQREVSVLP